MPRKPNEKSETDVVLTKALSELKTLKVTDEKYTSALDRVIKLHKMKQESLPPRVTPDTWALVGANLAGILLIIGHEHHEVITSKALGFLMKPR